MTTRGPRTDRFYWGDFHVDPVTVDGNLYRPDIVDIHRLHFFTLKDQISDKDRSFPNNADAWQCQWGFKVERCLEWLEEAMDVSNFVFDPDIVF